MLRIGLGLDGVIVDSIPYWIRVLNRELGMEYSPGDWPDTYATPELAARSDRHELEMLIAPPPVPGAIWGLNQVREQGHSVVVITARAPRLRQLTEAWLAYYGARVDELHFLQGASRVPAAKAARVDLMVEEAPHNALALAEAGMDALLFDALYNREVRHERIRRCIGWEGVLQAIGHLVAARRQRPGA